MFEHQGSKMGKGETGLDHYHADLRGDLGDDPLGVSLRHALDHDLPPGRLPREADLAIGHRNAIVAPSRHPLAGPTLRCQQLVPSFAHAEAWG